MVWDRRRFEHFWGWAYRFEAYTPAAKRKLGHYALPMLWRDRVVGWANATMVDGRLQVAAGYVLYGTSVLLVLATSRGTDRLLRPLLRITVRSSSNVSR